MRLSFQVAVLVLTSVATAIPATPPSVVHVERQLESRADRGSYTVSGLGSRKQAILNAGGNTLDLAIAMLETENMQTTYTYGNSTTWFSHHRIPSC